MARFGRGGGGRNDRDRVLSSYNSNRRRILGSSSRNEGRSFTVSRNGGGGDRRGDRNNNNNNRRGGGDRNDRGPVRRAPLRRRGGNNDRNDAPLRRRREGGGGDRGVRRSGRSGAVVRGGERRQVGKRDRVRNTRVGKRTDGDRNSGRDGGRRRLRKGAAPVGKKAVSKKSAGPTSVFSMDNMLEAYQQGKSETEIRAAGREAQIVSSLDDALSNYQNSDNKKGGAAAANNNKGGASLENSLDAYMKGN